MKPAKTQFLVKVNLQEQSRNHLCLKHKILLDTEGETASFFGEGKQMFRGTSTIENYFKPTKKLLERVVAELAAVDRISFNTISTKTSIFSKRIQATTNGAKCQKYYHNIFPNTENRYKENE